MKKTPFRYYSLALPLLLSLLTLLSACNSAPPFFAVVDENRILLQSTQGKQATLYSEKLYDVMQLNLTAVEQALATYPNKAQAREILINEMNRIQRILAEEREQLFLRVDAALAQAIANYQKKSGIAVVISAADTLGFLPGIDISDQVIPVFDASALSFPALPSVMQPRLPAPLPQ